MTTAKEIAERIELGMKNARQGGSTSILCEIANVRILLSALSEAEKERNEWKTAALSWKARQGDTGYELAKANDDARITNELLTAAVEDYNGALAALSEAEKERDRLTKDLGSTNAALSICGYGGDTHAGMLAAQKVTMKLAKENRKRAEKAEAERYALAMAICGGEDAPGYLDSVSVEEIVAVHKQNRQWQIDRAEKAEAELAQANAGKKFCAMLTIGVCDLPERLEAAEAELTQARKALEPFASCDPMDVYESEDDDANGCYVLTQSDFQRARAALITDTGRTEGEKK